MIPALDDEANPSSEALMSFLDELQLPMRALVHEYGAKIVCAMISDGCTDPFALADMLAVWRERKQEELLR